MKCWLLTSGLLLTTLSGCSSLNCCNWWGRNSDQSSNWGRKTTPIQQGPIAGTYNRPGANTTAPAPGYPASPGSAPVVTSTPVQTMPTTTIENSAPGLMPPAPPANMQSVNIQPANIQPMSSNTPPPVPTFPVEERSGTSTRGSFLPPNQLPAATASELPENKPSIPSPAIPSPQLAGPTIPGQSEGMPTPLLLAPPATPRNDIAPPNIMMPEVAMPAINKPMEIAMPKIAVTGKNTTLNPGTVPPPIPAPPVPPRFQ